MNPSNLSPGQFDMNPDPDTGQLFKLGATPPSQVEDPMGFAQRPDVMWHSSNTSNLNVTPGKQFHAGTVRAALDRRRDGIFHPVAIGGEWALAQGQDPGMPGSQRFDDEHANEKTIKGLKGSKAAVDTVRAAYAAGQVVPYVNMYENIGTTSISTTNPANVTQWQGGEGMEDYRLVGMPVRHQADWEIPHHVQEPLPFDRQTKSLLGMKTLYFNQPHLRPPAGIDIPLGPHPMSSINQVPAVETEQERTIRQEAFDRAHEGSRKGPMPNLYMGLVKVNKGRGSKKGRK